MNDRNRAMALMERLFWQTALIALGAFFALCWLFEDAEIADLTRRFW